MGFFGLVDPPKKQARDPSKGVSLDLLHRAECKACPLNRGTDCKHPKLKPSGDKEAIIYMLGASPSYEADTRGKPWAGPALKYLLSKIPNSVRPQLRWGNVIRTYPGEGPPVIGKDKERTQFAVPRAPTYVEIECCRPSVVRDIEEVKPKAIFGFGGIPLKWAANETHAYQWQGRRIPVKIGKHKCWYYPFVVPEDVMKEQRWEGHVSDADHTFSVQLRNAIRETLDEDMPTPVIHTEEYAKSEVRIITGDGGWSDVKEVKKFLHHAATMKFAGLDYETSAVRPYDGQKICTASVSVKGDTLAFALRHRQAGWTKEQLESVEEALEDFLYSPKVRKIAHQLAFEMEWSAVNYGKDVLRAGKWEDTISQAYVIDETQGLLALEALTMQYFGISIKDLSKNVDRANIDGSDLKSVLLYNGIDAKYHRLLHLRQMPILRELDMLDVYHHQLRRVPALVLTQIHGIPIDQKEVREFRAKFDAQVLEAEQELNKLPALKTYKAKYGADYRPTAAQDLAKMLKMLGFTLERTEKGGDATDEKNLKKIYHPVIKWTIKHRKASKILSTYVDAVTKGADGTRLYADGRVHPIISTYKVRTWRTSSEDPNIQNWPKRGVNVVIRKVVRKANMKVVAFDYGGIQARNVAMESKDPTLVQSFITGYDIHKDWVENLAQRYPKWAYKDLATNPKVFKDARGGVKNQFVFPTFFGASPKSITPSLAGSGRCAPPVQVVEEMQEEFFERFPKIKKWHLRLQADYKKNGYVTGLSGFRRHAPISYNEIINSPIQADEAIIVLEAMAALSELDYKRFTPMMEIHDDLTFLWPEDEIDRRADVVISEMCKPRFDWIDPVPLLVEMSVGDNWCDLKEVGKFQNVGRDGDYIEMH